MSKKEYRDVPLKAPPSMDGIRLGSILGSPANEILDLLKESGINLEEYTSQGEEGFKLLANKIAKIQESKRSEISNNSIIDTTTVSGKSWKEISEIPKKIKFGFGNPKL
jgi:hypothetical protein